MNPTIIPFVVSACGFAFAAFHLGKIAEAARTRKEQRQIRADEAVYEERDRLNRMERGIETLGYRIEALENAKVAK